MVRSSVMLDQEVIYESLKQIYDPEVGINIVDMGLIYSLDIEGSKVGITMTLTSPGCPAGPQILGQVDSALKALEGIEDVDIQVVWSPPWSPDMLSEDARDQLGIF
jgi:metal-sulfur cluster biosynthetic enzyme